MTDHGGTTWSSDPVTEKFGIECEYIGDGVTMARLKAGAEHCNMYGSVHGAILFAMADVGMGSAISKSLPEERRVSSITVSAHYMQAMKPGNIVAKSWVVRKGARIATLKTEISDENGDMCAFFSGNFYISEGRKKENG